MLNDDAFQAAVGNRSSAVVVNDDPVMSGYSQTVLRMAAERKLPIASVYPQFATNGGLMAYGPDLQQCTVGALSMWIES